MCNLKKLKNSLYRLPVVLGGRSRNDSTLLVSSPGALFSDEDEYS